MCQIMETPMCQIMEHQSVSNHRVTKVLLVIASAHVVCCVLLPGGNTGFNPLIFILKQNSAHLVNVTYSFWALGVLPLVSAAANHSTRFYTSCMHSKSNLIKALIRNQEQTFNRACCTMTTATSVHAWETHDKHHTAKKKQ
jgi:hypothetical protein